MTAKMKCSNCGAEINTLNMTWGRKYWWFTIPIMILGFWPLAKMTLFKADITKALVISDVTRRVDGTSLEIIGLITNQGGQLVERDRGSRILRRARHVHRRRIRIPSH